MDLLRTVHDHFASPQSVSRSQNRVTQGLRTWEQSLVDQYHTARGHMLNIGCGAGRETYALHQQGFSVAGIDIAFAELQSARQNLPERVPLFCTDGLRLPFAPESFHHITIWSQAFGNVPFASKRSFLLSQCYRVLRAGGTLSFSVHNLETCEPIAREKGWVIQSNTPEQGDFLLHGDTSTDSPCYWHYFIKSEVIDLCLHAGFTVEACESDSYFGQNWNNLWICVATK